MFIRLLARRGATLTLLTILSLPSSDGASLNAPTSATYTIGGTLRGLPSGEQITLLENGGNALELASNDSFTFPSPVAAASSYTVTVSRHPPGLECSVSNSTGTVGAADVASVSVSCAAGTESVLWSFGGASGDGKGPSGALVLDGAGNLYGTTAGGGAYSSGTVFKITASGRESVLHSFGGPMDGQTPVAGLLKDSSGNLYGTTFNGGIEPWGVVYKITAPGTESVLWSFGDQDGQSPWAGLVMDSARNLYGTTDFGGAHGKGTVFKIAPSGKESIMWSFGGPGDGQGPQARLLRDSAGNLYGTTSAGGTNGLGTVFKITPSGRELVLWSFGAPGDGQMPEGRLVIDSAGNLYGTTLGGGVHNMGAVFKITASGAESIVWSFGGWNGEGPSAGLVMDSTGNLYGTTHFGGAHKCGTVFEITASGAESVLWSFGGPGDGKYPQGILVMDDAGNLYGTAFDGGAHNKGAVFKIN